MNIDRLYTLIEAPVISEKSANAEVDNQYTFKMLPKANKDQIKNAIEQAFGVDVVAIRTMNVKGKTKRTRYGLGKRKSWKKAVVTVAEGQRIDYAAVE